MNNVLKVSDFISEKFIIDLSSNTKKEALQELLEVICTSDKITNEKKFKKAIFDREKLMSTGIGYEIAVPHARDRSVTDFVIALGRKKDGLEYESIDNKPVKLIIMIGASDRQDKDYIKLLSRLVLRLKNDQFVKALLNAPDTAEIYNLIMHTK